MKRANTGKTIISLVLVLALFMSYATGALADTLTLPDSVYTIEEEAFAGDSSLDEVVLPDSIGRIESRAFADSSLKKINLPSSLRYIADDAFSNSSMSEVDAEWNTVGANWAVNHGVKLSSSTVSDFSPEETIQSQGNTHAENGTDVTDYLGKCFTVQDVTGGWFKFTAPVAGSYTFSVRAPSITETFYIRVYANRTGTISEIQKFKFEQSDQVVSYTLNDVGEGEVIYWWDARSSNMGWTFKESFDLMVAPVETIATIEVQTAVITGVVRDAITGQGIPGVTVSVVNTENQQPVLSAVRSRSLTANASPVYSTVTDANGYYSLTAPVGPQLLHFELPGYISFDQTVRVMTGGGEISPTILSQELDDNQYRVVLTWGTTPADLDSHLVNSNFHVYYSQKTTSASDAMLDLDDTNGEGPETITFTAESNQSYSYYVKDYTNRDSTSSSALSASGATVMIYHGDNVIMRTVPRGVGVYWHVFDLVNGSIQYVDTIGNNEPTASGTEITPTISISSVTPTSVENDGESSFAITFTATNAHTFIFQFNGIEVEEAWDKNEATEKQGYKSIWEFDGASQLEHYSYSSTTETIRFYPRENTAIGEYSFSIKAIGNERDKTSDIQTIAVVEPSNTIIYTMGTSRGKSVKGIQVYNSTYKTNGTDSYHYFPEEAKDYGIIDFSSDNLPYSLNSSTVSCIETIRKSLYGSGKTGAVTALWGEYYSNATRSSTTWSSNGLHEGIDLQGDSNTADIYSLTDGIVTQAGTGSYGVIAIEKGEYWVIYMHCSSCDVNVGDKVYKGQKIGNQGNKGTVAYHVHLSLFPKSWNGAIPSDLNNDINETYQGLGRNIYELLSSLISSSSAAPITTELTKENMLLNLSSSSCLGNRKEAGVILAGLLWDSGFSPAYIAGVVANICSEGTIGGFENISGYTQERLLAVYPSLKKISDGGSGHKNYIAHMKGFSEYDNCGHDHSEYTQYSNKNIYDGFSLTAIDSLLSAYQAENWNARFGLGIVQWTADRTIGLMGYYHDEAGSSDTITYEQCLNAEMKYVNSELLGSKYEVFTGWLNANSGSLDTYDAAENAGYRVAQYYESPGQTSEYQKRANKAREIYQVMLGV